VRVWRPQETNLQQINARIITLKSIFSGLQIYTPLKSTFNGLQFRRWWYGSHSIFIRLAVVGSQICKIPQEFEFIAGQGHPRSSILVSVDFLLIVNNYGRISPTVFEILTYKARKWLVFTTPPLFNALARGNPLEFQYETHPSKTRGTTLWWKLHNPNLNWLWVIHPCDRRIDGWTGDSICCAKHIMLSRAKNASDCTKMHQCENNFQKNLGGGTGLALRRPHRAARVHFVLHTF